MSQKHLFFSSFFFNILRSGYKPVAHKPAKVLKETSPFQESRSLKSQLFVQILDINFPLECSLSHRERKNKPNSVLLIRW